MKSKIKDIFRKLTAYNCIFCGAAVSDSRHIFCDVCEQELQILSCKSENGVYSAAYYDNPRIKKLILFMKDYKVEAANAYASHLIAEMLHSADIPDLEEYFITFAPRNYVSFLKKGFDQSYEIGKLLAKELYGDKKRCLRLYKGSLFSKQQKLLGKDERYSNVSHNLKAKKNASFPEKLIIIDDVTTTGSTLGVLKDIALKCGTSSCILCTVARQRSKHNSDSGN